MWAIACLALVVTSWGLLAYLALADALLSGDTASDSSFAPVYGLLGLVTAAAPVAGIAALTAVRRQGQGWLAYLAFGLALLYPALLTIAIRSLRGGLWPNPD